MKNLFASNRVTFRVFPILIITLVLGACGGGGSPGEGGDTGGGTPRAEFNKAGGFNDEVFIIAPAGDGSGDIYVGGAFTTYNDTGSNYIVRLNSDGTVDTGFSIGEGFGNSVESIVPANDGSGDIYVGGGFRTFDGNSQNRIVRLNNDGTLDTGFSVGSGFNQRVNTMVLAPDGSGDIYVGGGFQTYNGSVNYYIVRLNNDGTLDTGFATGTGFSGTVETIATAANLSGDIYVGGSFSSYDGIPGNRIARLSSTGILDTSFSIGDGFNSVVYSIEPAADLSGDIYVGGGFTTYDSIASKIIARLKADGTLATGFSIGTGFNSTVYDISRTADGSDDIFVAGGFLTYNGVTSSKIVRLNSDGTVDSGFSFGADFSSTVYSIVPAMDASGDIYVGGGFSTYAGTSSNNLARLNSDGTVDAGFTVGGGFSDVVNSIAPSADGSADIYVGGEFTVYDSTSLNRVARLNSDGTVDTGFATTGTGLNGRVYSVALALDGSGDIYVGGSFTSYDGATSNRMVRLDSDGLLDTGFSVVGAGFNNTVNSILPAADGSGDIYVGGNFSFYDSIIRRKIVRLDSDGTYDTGFSIGEGFNNSVNSIASAIDASGDIYVGGSFTDYDGTGATRIARLNNNGTLDTTFLTGTGFNNSVNSIVPAADGSGDIYVGGEFSTYDGINSNKIARLNSDGTLDTGFSTGIGLNGGVNSLTLATDGSGDIYVGGTFTAYNGIGSIKAVRLNSDGTRDSGFAVGTGFRTEFDISVNSIAPAVDGSDDVYFGGSFTSYQSTTVDYVARINPAGALN